MADFCRPCSIKMFGEGYIDIKAPKDHVLHDLCEGCGPGTFDDEGDPVELKDGAWVKKEYKGFLNE